MIDYDSMNVEDLFEVYGHMHGDGVRDVEYPFQLYGQTWAVRLYEIQKIIRRKVIEEASVGTYIHACDFPAEDVVYMNDDKALPIGDYRLIPKEGKQVETK